MIRPKYRGGAATPHVHLQQLPNSLKFTNNENQLNIPQIRHNLRISKVDHKKFDEVLESKEGKKYYKDVYKKNEATYHPLAEEGTQRYKIHQKILGVRMKPTEITKHDCRSHLDRYHHSNT